ncbi:hypothetical protein B0G57_101488 [Trinickia symbiotica]|uniref:Hpt domain-containing protein n=3 Tax=Trinickia symbiotica TaxID=863227 RepID=A0A2N7X7X0_9BURK|nr:hypothetical protein C0Z20_03270 [Trinickia symbiotica]PPK47523.1 hypothetical protein B0G57_101488 [Trinickia symbiotica]
MSRRRNEQAGHAAIRFDLCELLPLYERADLRCLIVRALAEFDDTMSDFDAYLAAGAYANAASALHRMKGTASFFRGAEEAIAVLHDAERALKFCDANVLPTILPQARSILAVLSTALSGALADLDGARPSEAKR